MAPVLYLDDIAAGLESQCVPTLWRGCCDTQLKGRHSYQCSVQLLLMGNVTVFCLKISVTQLIRVCPAATLQQDAIITGATREWWQGRDKPSAQRHHKTGNRCGPKFCPTIFISRIPALIQVFVFFIIVYKAGVILNNQPHVASWQSHLPRMLVCADVCDPKSTLNSVNWPQ